MAICFTAVAFTIAFSLDVSEQLHEVHSKNFLFPALQFKEDVIWPPLQQRKIVSISF